MMFSVQFVLFIMSLIAAGGFLTHRGSVQANSNNGKHVGWEFEQELDTRPGHGWGDDNHDHTGPPGKTTVPERPGHGHGDDNHDHTGPPGHDDDDGDDD